MKCNYTIFKALLFLEILHLDWAYFKSSFTKDIFLITVFFPVLIILYSALTTRRYSYFSFKVLANLFTSLQTEIYTILNFSFKMSWLKTVTNAFLSHKNTCFPLLFVLNPSLFKNIFQTLFIYHMLNNI